MAQPAHLARIGVRLEVVPSPGWALLGLVLMNLMWGGSLPATKLARGSLGPFTLAAARLLLASVLFLVVQRPTTLRRLPKRDALTMAGLGVIGFAGVQVLQALGTGQTSAATATVLASTSPLWIALLAPVFLGEPVRPWPVVGAAGGRWRRASSVVLASLMLAGCTTSAPSAEPPPATAVLRSTPSGPTPSLPLARPAAPSPSPAEASGGAALASQQTLRLQSSAFAIGGAIPADYTCDGADLSPPLSWSGAPIRTTAFTLLEQDIDTPRSTEPFTQWLIYNIPSRVTALDAGIPARLVLTNGAQQGQNDHQTIGYFGPCPNRGDPPHHYSFQLIAQDAYVTLETGARVDAVRQALAGHSLGEAKLVAMVQR